MAARPGLSYNKPSMSSNRPPSEVFERYALGLADKERLGPQRGSAEREARRNGLLAELAARGIRGWPQRRTLYTRALPEGCRPCLKGQGSNLCLTTLCNRSCFFCFNPKPRSEAMSVHGKTVDSEDEIPAVLEGFGVRSVGLGGGEPLLDPGKALRVIRLLRARLGPSMRIDLYTNGDFLTPELLSRLQAAGLDALRINIVPGGYKTGAVGLALKFFREVAVEIPAIPGHLERLKSLVSDLDLLGAPHLILHELFCSAQNLDSLRRLGLRADGARPPERLSWSAVSGSEEAALAVLAYALDNARALSVYYCSCGTQDWIAEEALKRRRGDPGGVDHALEPQSPGCDKGVAGPRAGDPPP